MAEPGHGRVLETRDQSTGRAYLGNGYMGLELSPLGGFLPGSDGSRSLIRGLYSDTGSGGIDRLVPITGWADVRYERAAEVVAYRRCLDLPRGAVVTNLTVREERGTVEVEQIVIVSRADPHTAVVRTIMRPDFDGDVSVVTLDLSAPPGLVDPALTWEPVPCVCARTRKYGVEVALAQHILGNGWTGELPSDAGIIERRLTTTVEAGEESILTLVTRFATSLDAERAREAVMRSPESYESIVAAHQVAHDGLRETAIQIDGDDDAQRFVDAGLFYLWNGIGADDQWSIPPMGLYGDGYNGHIFWDAETWMYPALLVTHPSLARSCLAYRERTVDAARERAEAEGRAGVRFPWEGGFTGAEMTPHWAEPRELQIHITADVAIAFWWYFLNCRDVAWLRVHGFPIIKRCAEYYVDRVELGTDGLYHLRDIQCADEYASNVDDDAYTNMAVAYCLRSAARAAEILGVPAPSDWRRIAERMAVLRAPDGRIVEFDGYDGRTIKQADVALLTFPLEVTSDTEAGASLDYYAPRTDPNGPAMSFSVYAIVACGLGRPDEALQYLRRSYQPNVHRPFDAVSETPGNNSFLFCTGIGGSLQAIVFGFAGVRLREWGFEIGPALPAEWSGLRLRNMFLAGCRVDIEIKRSRITVSRRIDGEDVVLTVARDQTGVSIQLTGGVAGFRVGSSGGVSVESSDREARLNIAPGDGIRVTVVGAGGARIPDIGFRWPAG